jgi:DNA mismatch endonuclease (patch repair protein)
LPDIVDAATRSRMMSGIRGTNTKPELAIRRGLHAAGFRYRLHAKDVPGRPDIVLPRYRAAIFVNGCFWHGHDCHLFRLPGTREEFWQDKINRNRQRDAEVEAVLAAAGWRRLTIWECALRGRTKIGLEDAVACTIEWIRGDSLSAELRGMS